MSLNTVCSKNVWSVNYKQVLKTLGIFRSSNSENVKKALGLQSTLSKTDTFGSLLERCPSYRESNKRSNERQGPTLGVRLIEVFVKRESTVLSKTTTLPMHHAFLVHFFAITARL